MTPLDQPLTPDSAENIPRFDPNSTHFVAWIVCGSVGVIFLIVITFFIVLRRSRLNWYEKNLLEISEAYPEIIHRQLHRSDDSLDDTTSTESCPAICSTSASGRRDLFGSSAKIFSKKYRSRHHSDGGESPSPSRSTTTVPASETIPNFWVPPAYRYRQSMIYHKKPFSKENLAQNLFKQPSKPSMFRNISQAEIDKTLYDLRQDSAASDEVVLGQCGSLQMAVSYDSQLEIFTLRLLQANDLTAKRSDGLPNPYFKVSLLLRQKSTQSYQTKVYGSTRSTEVDEEFFFHISKDDLSSTKLEVLVYDYEQYSVDECIGCCLLSLVRLEIPRSVEEKSIFWAEVLPVFEEEATENYGGDILFRVQYLAKAQRLTVTIFKARNLHIREDTLSEPPDTCVRVTMSLGGKKLKRKKTSTKRGTYNPVWNESLSFGVTKISICDLTLEFSVLHEPNVFVSKPLARIEVPLHKCKELWKSFLNNSETPAKWYSLERVQNP